MSLLAQERIMGFIDNLPVILASSTAFLAGLYGYLNDLPNIRVYQNMSLFLIVFYIVGALVKRTAKTIWEEHQEKAALSAEAALLLEGSLESGAGPDGENDAEYAGYAVDGEGIINEAEVANEADGVGGEHEGGREDGGAGANEGAGAGENEGARLNDGLDENDYEGGGGSRGGNADRGVGGANNHTVRVE